MYSSTESPGVSSSYSSNYVEKNDCCDETNTVSNIALAILLVSAVVVAASFIFHPVLFVPGVVIAVAGSGTLLFSYDAPRSFFTNIPSYFSGYSSRPGYYSSARASSSSFVSSAPSRPARASYAAAPSYAPSSAYVSNGGFGGVGVFPTRNR